MTSFAEVKSVDKVRLLQKRFSHRLHQGIDVKKTFFLRFLFLPRILRF